MSRKESVEDLVEVAELHEAMGEDDQAITSLTRAARVAINHGKYQDAASLALRVCLSQAPNEAGAELLGGMALRGLLDADSASLAVNHVGAGEFLFQRGDSGDTLELLLGGKAQLQLLEKEGQSVISTLSMGPGNFVGELGLLGDGQRHFDAVAISDLLALKVQKSRVEQLAKQSKAVNRQLRQAYRERLQSLLMARSPLFRQMAPTDAEALFKAGRPQSLAVGGRIEFRETANQGIIYAVLLGTVKLRAGTRKRVLEDGDVFGSLLIPPEDWALARAKSVTFSQLLAIPEQHLKTLRDAHPELSAALEMM